MTKLEEFEKELRAMREAVDATRMNSEEKHKVTLTTLLEIESRVRKLEDVFRIKPTVRSNVAESGRYVKLTCNCGEVFPLDIDSPALLFKRKCDCGRIWNISLSQ